MNKQPRPRPFSQIGAAKPSYSIFNLSYEKKFTCDMGQLIPVVCDECVPGDHWKIGNNSLVRFNPMVAPVLHEVKVLTDYFFVPYRILWNEWEDFYTRGKDGKLEVPLPKWNPTKKSKGSLWDFLGLPIDVDPKGAYPVDFIRRAYNLIYNEYYRDETLTDEVSLTNEDILNCSWQKDYFSSALPWQQRGDPIAVPLTGYASAFWDVDNITDVPISYSTAPPLTFSQSEITYTGLPNANLTGNARTIWNENLTGMLNTNVIDVSSIATFNINELRFAFQLQKYLERGARGGYRYIEQLKSRFGVHPRDDRLSRPEYIGGTRSPVWFSEVLQTSSSDDTTPQGNMSGHGITNPAGFAGRYRVQEFGLLVGIMRVRPAPSYQQGINRQWLKDVVEDFYSPEFANLGEQDIKVAEIYASDVEADNIDIFGFQGRWDELRYKPNMVCSDMRDVFNYWHLGRIFNSRPYLNAEFVECRPSKRIFAVQNVPGLIVSYGNVLTAARPLPVISEPGLIDHH